MGYRQSNHGQLDEGINPARSHPARARFHRTAENHRHTGLFSMRLPAVPNRKRLLHHPHPRRRLSPPRLGGNLLWKQHFTEASSEFVAEMVLVYRNDRYLVDHVMVF